MGIIMDSNPTFVIIGGAGKIAKYHFEAIEKVGGEIVGVIDPLYPHPQYAIDNPTDYQQYASIEDYDQAFPMAYPEYFVICSPNYLHVEHAVKALKYADVICEKPLAISTSELAHLKSEESLGQTKVHPIMQMRKHPTLLALHEQFQEIAPYEIDIDYVLPRGEDYDNSWQGDKTKSGGIVFNIAMHMLDFLVWTFGEYQDLRLGYNRENCILGSIRFPPTMVYFKFSTILNSPPQRTLEFDGHKMDLMSHIPLHTLAYRDIIAGNPLYIPDIEPTIKLCEEIRNYK